MVRDTARQTFVNYRHNLTARSEIHRPNSNSVQFQPAKLSAVDVPGFFSSLFFLFFSFSRTRTVLVPVPYCA